ncbi:hypothetical protein LCGC14_1361890 [marine sediment metagenome]|uniref:Uncharacterized protein n=1 Tax=marine sediment metagenome TaxID=412755 RepID=A0A0F9NA02_9ZZZZ
MKWVLVALLAVLLGCTSPDGVIEEPNRDGVSWQWLSGWALDVGWATEARGEV